MTENNIDEIVQKILDGDRRMLARAITLVENRRKGHRNMMRQVYPHTGNAMIVGITGAGGAGKSTLTDILITKFRKMGKTVGIVLVDPSSPFTGGAMLGDRIRMKKHARDKGVYIRSIASRGAMGGLSRATYDIIRIIEAFGVDIIIVETLGTGQDEIDIIHLVHTCLVVFTPGMGDDIQAMKAGILEIADLIIMNKADLEGAEAFIRHLQGAVTAANIPAGAWTPMILPCISVSDKPANIKGQDKIIKGIYEHFDFLNKSKALDKIKFRRLELELGLILKDELQNLIFKGLKGTGLKKKYIDSIIGGENDPYSVVKDILDNYVLQRRLP
ncbi:MAG: methylmalonyl Co-A mutase-associated GTPase MeaB [Desulfosarcina sp.]|nr:methylmalonyl Co-A mutase-associated GTPase MeaB [Desulfobacterales bacterium]